VFLATRPDARAIARFVAESADLPLSYAPVGLTEHGGTGFRLDETVAVIGRGEAAWARATIALSEWRHFDLGWVEIHPSRPATVPGTVVGVLIQHLGFWSLNGCRVVNNVGSASDSVVGFSYGTLSNHAECGEERFELRFDAATGAVTYIVRAASKPRAFLARLGGPVVRHLQARFRQDSTRAMARAIGS
jgi:uncharacterized protein (UPF0548 family)